MRRWSTANDESDAEDRLGDAKRLKDKEDDEDDDEEEEIVRYN